MLPPGNANLFFVRNIPCAWIIPEFRSVDALLALRALQHYCCLQTIVLPELGWWYMTSNISFSSISIVLWRFSLAEFASNYNH